MSRSACLAGSSLHVRVTFDVERQETNFDVSLSKLMYDSQLGWSGTAEVTATFGNNALTFAGLSNADDAVDRYSGIRTRSIAYTWRTTASAWVWSLTPTAISSTTPHWLRYQKTVLPSALELTALV